MSDSSSLVLLGLEVDRPWNKDRICYKREKGVTYVACLCAGVCVRQDTITHGRASFIGTLASQESLLAIHIIRT